MRFLSRVLFASAVACCLAACGIATPSSLTTEPVFSGTVSPGAITSGGTDTTSGTATFTSKKTGEFILKITSLTPDSGATLQAQYGTPVVDTSGNPGCSLVNAGPAGLNRSAFDLTLPAGTYCVQFADPGPGTTLPRTESFQATIQHS